MKLNCLHCEKESIHSDDFQIYVCDNCYKERSVKTYVRKKNQGKKIGWTCGAFDVLHPGHIELFKDAKSKCDYLMVGLQVDPSVDRSYKHKPIQSVEERYIMLESIKYVDEIMIYHTENELIEILNTYKPDIRINGSDWTGKKFTGRDLGIPHHFHQRNHSWSTTNIRERIYEEEKKLRNTK